MKREIEAARVDRAVFVFGEERGAHHRGRRGATEGTEKGGDKKICGAGS
jgi:hypothetical protein